MAEAFRRQLRAYLDRECDGNQSEGARKTGLRQSHISQLLSGTRTIGLAGLLVLRERTGRSIDEWLGLHQDMDAVRAIVRDELAKRAP